MLTKKMLDRIEYADRLAIKAYAAALAGKREEAARLRAEIEKIYDELEAAAAAQPAGA